MPRNLDRRVEAVFPVEDEGWRTYLRDDVLGLYLRDTSRAHELQPDGSYVRLLPAPGQPPVDAQEVLLAAARTLGVPRRGAGAAPAETTSLPEAMIRRSCRMPGLRVLAPGAARGGAGLDLAATILGRSRAAGAWRPGTSSSSPPRS